MRHLTAGLVEIPKVSSAREWSSALKTLISISEVPGSIPCAGGKIVIFILHTEILYIVDTCFFFFFFLFVFQDMVSLVTLTCSAAQADLKLRNLSASSS